jgi:hypothetical protein
LRGTGGHRASEEKLQGWFAGRLPDDWFEGQPEITTDREEILIVGKLAEPTLDKDASDETRAAGKVSRIERFREETRERRMAIAREAQWRFRRKVSWGAECGDQRRLFTTASVPVMTRLRMNERGVLDTLVAAGVARSRSEALAWCVKLVGENEEQWLGKLREAFEAVERIASEGPAARIQTV